MLLKRPPRNLFHLFKFVLLCAACTSFAERDLSAQKLYVVIAADTEDVDIGESARADVTNIETTLKQFLPGAEVEVLKEQSFNEKRVKDKLKAVVAKAGVDDAIMFYFCGHGFLNTDTDRLTLQFPNDQFMPRSDVNQILSASDARLKIIISDACAFKIKLAMKEYVPPSLDASHAGIRRLFNNYSGTLDIASASPGQEAFGLETGGLFTSALMSVLRKKSAVSNVTWQRVFAETSEQTRLSFVANKSMFPTRQKTQTPQAYSYPRLIPPSQNDPSPGLNSGNRVPFGIAVSTVANGVRIDRVTADSPATRVVENATGRNMYLERGDIIVSVNGAPVRDSQDFINRVNQTDRDLSIGVIDVRTGRIRNFSAVLRDNSTLIFNGRTKSNKDGLRVGEKIVMFNGLLMGDDVKRSRWDTTYVAANGQRINSTLIFNGRTGTYTTPAGQGQLSQIEYEIDTGSGNLFVFGAPFNVYISGVWQLGNSSGRFFFNGRISSTRQQLSGRWGFGESSSDGGTWDASYRGLKK